MRRQNEKEQIVARVETLIQGGEEIKGIFQAQRRPAL